VPARSALDQHKNAAFIFLDNRKRPTSGLQQRGELSLDKPMLFPGIAYMPQRWSHVERSASLTFEKDVVTAQMHFGRLAGCAQLFQVAIAEFALFVSFIADGLRIGDALGDRRRGACGTIFARLRIRSTCWHVFAAAFVGISTELELNLTQ
jgi:hypothetical protein